LERINEGEKRYEVGENTFIKKTKVDELSKRVAELQKAIETLISFTSTEGITLRALMESQGKLSTDVVNNMVVVSGLASRMANLFERKEEKKVDEEKMYQ